MKTSKQRKGWKVWLIVLGVVPLLLVGGVGAALLVLTHRVHGEYFDSNGVAIHYTVEGKGEPLVLLHGFAVNDDLNWRLPGLTKELAKKYQVISLDLRGHGLSGKPHDANAYGDEMVEDVVRLLDRLEIEKAHVAGYSLGGFITLKLAAEYPERLITASVLGAGWENPHNQSFVDSIPSTVAALRAGKGVGPLASNLGPNREKPSWLHTVWVRLLTNYFNDPEALIGVVKGIPELAISEEQVRSIALPVCGIVGGRDPMRISAMAMEGRVPHLRLVVIDGADHITTQMKKETLDVLLSCLERGQ